MAQRVPAIKPHERLDGLVGAETTMDRAVASAPSGMYGSRKNECQAKPAGG